MLHLLSRVKCAVQEKVIQIILDQEAWILQITDKSSHKKDRKAIFEYSEEFHLTKYSLDNASPTLPTASIVLPFHTCSHDGIITN